MAEHEDLHVRFERRTQIVQVKQVWRNKEDLHGGPGYREVERIIAEASSHIPEGDMPKHVTVKRLAT